jgi:hypothetical protein
VKSCLQPHASKNPQAQLSQELTNALACSSQKKPDAVDVERIQKLVADQQKRGQRWSELQQEALKLQNEFQTKQKQIEDVTEDAFHRAGIDRKDFRLDLDKQEFVAVPKSAVLPVKAPPAPTKYRRSRLRRNEPHYLGMDRHGVRSTRCICSYRDFPRAVIRPALMDTLHPASCRAAYRAAPPRNHP